MRRVTSMVSEKTPRNAVLAPINVIEAIMHCSPRVQPVCPPQNAEKKLKGRRLLCGGAILSRLRAFFGEFLIHAASGRSMQRE
jgi:hypothetical protein